MCSSISSISLPHIDSDTSCRSCHAAAAGRATRLSSRALRPVAASRTGSADQTDNLCRKLRGSEPVQQQSTAVSPLLSAVQRGSPTLSAPERRLARSTPSLCKQGVRVRFDELEGG
jgi:hypothetical protein